MAIDAERVAATALPYCLERLVEYFRGKGDAAGVQAYEPRLDEARTTGAIQRWYRGLRGNGRQRVDAVGGRSWWGSKGLW